MTTVANMTAPMTVGAVTLLVLAAAPAWEFDSARLSDPTREVLSLSTAVWVPTYASDTDEREDMEAWLTSLDDDSSDSASVDEARFTKVSWIPGVGLVSRSKA